MNIIHKRHILWIWILFLTPFSQIGIICQKYWPIYLNIFEYKKNQIPGVCYLPVWRLWKIYHNLFVTFHSEFWVEQIVFFLNKYKYKKIFRIQVRVLLRHQLLCPWSLGKLQIPTFDASFSKINYNSYKINQLC